MESIWSIGADAKKILESELSVEARLVEELFDLADDVIIALNRIPDAPACRIGALALLKARRLATGAYLLSLHALAQEGGALFRPLQEPWEFLAYLREDPARVGDVLEGKAPRAGEIGKRIDSAFKDMRDYLNQHSSHLAFSFEAMGHLVDLQNGTVRLGYKPSAKVIKTNIASLFGVTFMAVGEGIRLLAPVSAEEFDRLATCHEELQAQSRIAFKSNSDAAGTS